MKRNIVIFGRSIPLAGIMAAVLVISAVAWALWLAGAFTSTATITVKEAPQDLDVELTLVSCSRATPFGEVVDPVGSWDPVTNSASCEFYDFTDESIMEIRVMMTNPNPVPIIVDFVAPVADPCVNVVWVPGASIPLAIGESTVTGKTTSFEGTAETITCAGQTIDFVTEFSIVEG